LRQIKRNASNHILNSGRGIAPVFIKLSTSCICLKQIENIHAALLVMSGFSFRFARYGAGSLADKNIYASFLGNTMTVRLSVPIRLSSSHQWLVPGQFSIRLATSHTRASHKMLIGQQKG
jgi:hypothetical protein